MRYRFPILALMTLLTLLACGPVPEAAPEEVVVDPLRFSQVVSGYKAADSLQMPRPNSILFVGSSSIHGWHTLAEDFAELRVINRGMGGSHMSDLLYYMDDIVFPYKPNAIVVYEGDNDIAAGKTPERVLKDVQTFVEKVHATWPNKPIFYVAIKPSLARVQVLEHMGAANELIKAYLETVESAYFVDVYHPMLNEQGLPREDIFSDDGLHMNATGYALWTQILRQEMGLD